MRLVMSHEHVLESQAIQIQKKDSWANRRNPLDDLSLEGMSAFKGLCENKRTKR